MVNKITKKKIIAKVLLKLGTKAPSNLYHETVMDFYSSLKSQGLTPQVGKIVEQAYDDPELDSLKGLVFYSTDKKELGGYIVMAISKIRDIPMGDVTWDMIEEQGLLCVVKPSQLSSYEKIYKYVSQGELYDTDGKKVEDHIEDEEGEWIYPEDCCPRQVESGDWFSYTGSDVHEFVKGKKLVELLKSVSSNAWIKKLK